jgi:hypothetical protein
MAAIVVYVMVKCQPSEREHVSVFQQDTIHFTNNSVANVGRYV